MGIFCQHLWQHSWDMVIRSAQLLLSTSLCLVPRRGTIIGCLYPLVEPGQEAEFCLAGHDRHSFLVCKPGAWRAENDLVSLSKIGGAREPGQLARRLLY